MNLTPQGCSNIAGELALSMERTRQAALSFFSSYGYNPFNPAEFQLLEGVMASLPRKRRDRVIALCSPFGEPCCLRADITLSALTHASMHCPPGDFPVRLCYAERIFASPVPPRGNLEDTQIGAELLGWSSPGCDVEVTSMLMRALDELGLVESVIVLGDAALLPALTRGAPDALRAHLAELLQDGSLCDYGAAVRDCPDLFPAARDALAELPWLKGGPELLGEARRLIPAGALEGISSLCGSLERLGFGGRIKIDLGFVRGLNYYTGPIFNVYSREDGEPLGGGGRYDGTLGSSPERLAACGFGLGLRELARARAPEPAKQSAALWPGSAPCDEVMNLAGELAADGVPFAIIWDGDEARARNAAIARGCAWWLDAGARRTVNLATGEERDGFDAARGVSA